MKLVTQTDVTAERFGDEKAVRMICESGFDGIDYSMFVMNDSDVDSVLNTDGYLAHVKNLRAIAESYGKTFEQSHAPFPSYKAGNDEYNKAIAPMLRRAIEITGVLGAKVCVIHPVALGESQREFNLDLYNGLLETAKEYGVKIALENMWGRKDGKIVPNICSVPDDFNSYVDALDPEYFTACLDLGHCGLVGEDTADMIRSMGGKRITALHIHDNNGIADEHTIPYLRSMDFDSILKALADINYSGNFTYEADYFLKRFPSELFPTLLKFMHDIGRYMISEIERYKAQ